MLRDVAPYLAVFATVAAVALAGVVVWVTLTARRLQAGQRAVLGPHGRRDLVEHTEMLEDQVRKSVRIGAPQKPTGRTPPILRQFFHSLAEVRELLRTDIEAAYEGDPAALYSEEIILSYPFIEAIAIQRLAHILYVAGAPIIPRMMTEWAHSRTGIDIHPGARIG